MDEGDGDVKYYKIIGKIEDCISYWAEDEIEESDCFGIKRE